MTNGTMRNTVEKDGNGKFSLNEHVAMQVMKIRAEEDR